MTLRSKLLWVTLFGVSFAFIESSVVVYLRSIYYPEGFTFPLKLMNQAHLLVELVREAATILMLAAVGVLAGRGWWERFGFFVIAFGVWDIFYYVWLKVALDWPSSLFDWDILFLIPLPWVGPVVAPVLISVLMIVFGYLIVVRIDNAKAFNPRSLSWSLAIAGVVLAFYSFIQDVDATLHRAMPSPYGYELLLAALVLFTASFISACRNPVAHPHAAS